MSLISVVERGDTDVSITAWDSGWYSNSWCSSAETQEPSVEFHHTAFTPLSHPPTQAPLHSVFWVQHTHSHLSHTPPFTPPHGLHTCSPLFLFELTTPTPHNLQATHAHNLRLIPAFGNGHTHYPITFCSSLPQF